MARSQTGTFAFKRQAMDLLLVPVQNTRAGFQLDAPALCMHAYKGIKRVCLAACLLSALSRVQKWSCFPC
jgi:hypothetical protein